MRALLIMGVSFLLWSAPGVMAQGSPWGVTQERGALDRSEREELAKSLLKEVKSFNSTLPVLDPQQRKLVESEVKKLRNNEIHGDRANELINSKEFLVYDTRDTLKNYKLILLY